jgi:hypothetical protein
MASSTKIRLGWEGLPSLLQNFVNYGNKSFIGFIRALMSVTQSLSLCSGVPEKRVSNGE